MDPGAFFDHVFTTKHQPNLSAEGRIACSVQAKLVCLWIQLEVSSQPLSPDSEVEESLICVFCFGVWGNLHLHPQYRSRCPNNLGPTRTPQKRYVASSHSEQQNCTPARPEQDFQLPDVARDLANELKDSDCLCFKGLRLAAMIFVGPRETQTKRYLPQGQGCHARLACQLL